MVQNKNSFFFKKYLQVRSYLKQNKEGGIHNYILKFIAEKKNKSILKLASKSDTHIFYLFSNPGVLVKCSNCLTALKQVTRLWKQAKSPDFQAWYKTIEQTREMEKLNLKVRNQTDKQNELYQEHIVRRTRTFQQVHTLDGYAYTYTHAHTGAEFL